MKSHMMHLLLALALVFTGALWAQDDDDAPMPQGHMAKMLNLSDAQQAKISDLRLQLNKEMIPLRSQLETLRGNLKLAMTEDSFDEGKVRKLIGEISDLRSQMAMKRIQHHRAIRDQLTPEQRKKFDAFLLSNKRGKHKGMGRGMRDHDGPRPPHGPNR